MSASPDIGDAPTGPEAPAADGWSERKLAILSELAEAGLEIALALKTRIVETATLEPDPACAGTCADLTRAFDRASRATRMAIALRDRLMKDEPPPGQAERTAIREARRERAERVRRIVGRAIRAQFDDFHARRDLDRHASERLFDTDITGELANRSIGELVARICADLGIAPRWLDFAGEAWAQAEITERPKGSPYADWPELPPEEPDPEPLEDDLDDDDPEDDEGEDESDDPGGGDPRSASG
jgi:hypothetical protein